MRLAFVDFSGWDYTVDTPYQRPFGGSHSGLCYLAEELARQGHEVWILNGVAVPTVSRGVRVARIDEASVRALASADAVIVLNGCAFDRAATLRRALGDGPMFVYWTQHADDQPASANLHDPAMRALWDAFVLISDWQAERYRSVFGLPAERVMVLRNAIGPSFHDMFSPDDRTRAGRDGAPVLAYTSTPFRGLNVLLGAFPRIRAAIPGATLKVFSSMAVYQVDRGSDQYADLYDLCQATEGVEYVGSLPQPELARALRGVTCLSYPNTFAETSCIAAMEAMAAGCMVVTSSLGALPETLGDFGFTMPPPDDPGAYAARFADLTVRVLRLMADDPERTERYLADQVGTVNATATWVVRARQWAAWLAERSAGRWSARAGFEDGVPLAQRLSGRVPTGGGRAVSVGRHGVYVSDGAMPEGRALQRHGEPDEPVAQLLGALLRPHDTAVEVGAGLGTVTVPLARTIGPGGLMVALETRPAVFPLLCATLALNGLTQVRPLPAPPAGGLAEGLDACRLLRIDAGGDEAAVLAEAEALIARFRPILYCRVTAERTFDALAPLAARFGYRLYWHGHRRAGEEGGAPVVSLLALPDRSPLAVEGAPATAFDEAARLFPGFQPAP